MFPICCTSHMEGKRPATSARAFCSPFISCFHDVLHPPGSRCLLESPNVLAKGSADRSHLGQQRERERHPPPGELRGCFLFLFLSIHFQRWGMCPWDGEGHSSPPVTLLLSQLSSPMRGAGPAAGLPVLPMFSAPALFKFLVLMDWEELTHQGQWTWTPYL